MSNSRFMGAIVLVWQFVAYKRLITTGVSMADERAASIAVATEEGVVLGGFVCRGLLSFDPSSSRELDRWIRIH